jgi:hypothetical protein
LNNKTKITVAVDISPLLSPNVGIVRAVSGLMSELPTVASSKGINVRPYFRKALESLDFYGIRGT